MGCNQCVAERSLAALMVKDELGLRPLNHVEWGDKLGHPGDDYGQPCIKHRFCVLFWRGWEPLFVYSRTNISERQSLQTRLLCFLFFSALWRGASGGKREACRSDEMREPSFWYFWMSKISISLSITHFNKHSLSLRVAPPAPELVPSELSSLFVAKIHRDTKQNPPQDLARRCHTAAPGLLANHHWCCHDDDTATCWLKSGWFHVLMYFHV